MSPRKVLHVFGKMDRGGAEMRTLDLMRALRGTDIQFDFCALSGLPGELDGFIRELGGTIHYLPITFGFGHRFKKILREHSYVSVHSHVHLFSGYLLKLAHRVGVPSRICHLHTTGGYGVGHLRKRLQNIFMRRWLNRHATSIVAVSQGAMDTFLQWAPRFARDARLTVIHDAIDPDSFAQPPPRIEVRARFGVPVDQPMIIHVGRLDPVKNHVWLLEVFANISKRNPQVRLLMVGKTEPKLLAVLRQFADTHGIAEKIQFLDARDDVLDLLAAADLMIFPSLWEGLPGAVLEAAASGLTVLSSDLPGSREIAKHFDTVHFASLSESVDAWAQSATDLLAQPSIRSAAAERLMRSPFNIKIALSKLIPLWLVSER